VKSYELDFSISQLGECRIASPMVSGHFVDAADHVLYHNNLQAIEEYLRAGKPPLLRAFSRSSKRGWTGRGMPSSWWVRGRVRT
jgi:hypothetical protein